MSQKCANQCQAPTFFLFIIQPGLHPRQRTSLPQKHHHMWSLEKEAPGTLMPFEAISP